MLSDNFTDAHAFRSPRGACRGNSLELPEQLPLLCSRRGHDPSKMSDKHEHQIDEQLLFCTFIRSMNSFSFAPLIALWTGTAKRWTASLSIENDEHEQQNDEQLSFHPKALMNDRQAQSACDRHANLSPQLVLSVGMTTHMGVHVLT